MKLLSIVIIARVHTPTIRSTTVSSKTVRTRSRTHLKNPQPRVREAKRSRFTLECRPEKKVRRGAEYDDMLILLTTIVMAAPKRVPSSDRSEWSPPSLVAG